MLLFDYCALSCVKQAPWWSCGCDGEAKRDLRAANRKVEEQEQRNVGKAVSNVDGSKFRSCYFKRRRGKMRRRPNRARGLSLLVPGDPRPTNVATVWVLPKHEGVYVTCR